MQKIFKTFFTFRNQIKVAAAFNKKIKIIPALGNKQLKF